VEKFEPLIAFIPTVELMFRPFDIGNPTVGVAVKVRTYVSKDNVWHLWLGIHPGGFDASLVESSGKVSGYALGPLRRVVRGR